MSVRIISLRLEPYLDRHGKRRPPRAFVLVDTSTGSARVRYTERLTGARWHCSQHRERDHAEHPCHHVDEALPVVLAEIERRASA